MPAASDGALTRSDIEAWDTTHLETAATHWRSTAAHWESHFETIHNGMLRPGGTTWEGTAADAAAERSWADLVKVRGAGDALYAAAGHATTGAGDIAWAKRQVLDAIAEAEEAGFTVGQDFTVTDKSADGLLRSAAGRQQQAQAFATEISTRVQALAALDKQVATQITAALEPLETVQFSDEAKNAPTVQAVDYHHFKQDGPASPPPPPPGPSSSDIRSVLDQLPKGTTPDIREVRSPEDLQKLAKWMTQDGTDGFNRYRDPAKGAWKDLPDGSKVGERFAANSTGQPALDVNLQTPDGGEHWKVHINPQTGGEPNIPAPKAPPIEPQAPKATPAEPNSPRAPVTERAPEVGVRGWGGPSAEPFGPQPVHPPGSIHHHFPILGEDDPMENPRDFEGHS
ncbi:hypothetical protein [Mycolicibacterium mucogenicum]|uniref:hypothetical protein n=2 Tax=Mycobacteriaceae TaxID=1762 RepID=UPI00076AB6E1|nr:hypothetical protein [Mycolicibacterium mucogenicum]